VKLWHCADTRSFRVLWALEEIGLSYDIELMPFPPRAKVPGYLEINPLGTVPTFNDGLVTMTESSAIVHYLGTKYPDSGLAILPADPAYAEWLNWMYLSDATLTFPQTIVLRYGTFEPGRASNAADDYARWFLSRLKHVERKVSQADWLCGDRFTGADITVGYALLLASYLKLDARFPDAVSAYWARLKDRTAFQAAKKVQLIELAELLGTA